MLNDANNHFSPVTPYHIREESLHVMLIGRTSGYEMGRISLLIEEVASLLLNPIETNTAKWEW